MNAKALGISFSYAFSEFHNKSLIAIVLHGFVLWLKVASMNSRYKRQLGKGTYETELRTFIFNRIRSTNYTKDVCQYLQLAPEFCSLVFLDQDIAVRIRVDSQPVKRIQLIRPIEHILVNFAVLTTQ